MNNRARRGYRPGVEGVEERCVATAHLASAALAVHAQAVGLERPWHAAMVAARWHRHHLPGLPTPAGGLPTSPVGPGEGAGTVHLRLPYNFVDWGVVTLWNNTTSPVTFTVSASTFNNGQFYPFTLNSGQNQSFFAPVVGGRVPVFQVSFAPDNSGATPLPQVNVVFETRSYVPQGTAGWPYAIGFGVNGSFVSSI